MQGIYAYWDIEKEYYVYVGKDSFIDINKRHKAHLNPSNYDQQQFNRVLQNNPDRYQYRVLMKGDYTDWQLNKMEQFLINHFMTFYYDYPERGVFNFTNGGEGSRGYKHSEDIRRKMSENHADFSGENHPMYGRTFPIESKLKMSISQNNSEYFRVYKRKMSKLKQGFIWTYQYYAEGKRKSIASVSLDKLEEKVKSKGLEWYKLSDEGVKYGS